MDVLLGETEQLKTISPSDTYFCCEACGTIFESLNDVSSSRYLISATAISVAIIKVLWFLRLE